jgi:hypothetical protein
MLPDPMGRRAKLVAAPRFMAASLGRYQGEDTAGKCADEVLLTRMKAGDAGRVRRGPSWRQRDDGISRHSIQFRSRRNQTPLSQAANPVW